MENHGEVLCVTHTMFTAVALCVSPSASTKAARLRAFIIFLNGECEGKRSRRTVLCCAKTYSAKPVHFLENYYCESDFYYNLKWILSKVGFFGAGNAH